MRRSATLALATVVATTVAVMVGGTAGPSPAAAAELETFPGCPALLDRIVGDALEHVGPYGLDGAPMPMPLMEGMEVEAVADAGADTAGSGDQAAAPAEGAAGAESGAAEPGFTSETGTNVQVVGVDEPDQVKLAGDALAVIDGGRIRLLDVAGTTPVPLGAISTEGDLHPLTMLSAGDRLVVFGAPFGPMPTEPTLREGDDVAIVPWQRPETVVAVYDVTQLATPRLVDRMIVDGSFTSARLTGGRVILVTTGSPTVPFVHPAGGAGAEDRATEANRDAVLASTIDQWVAGVTFTDGTRRPVADCERVGVPTEITSWQSVSIAAFDPGAPLTDVQGAATFGAGHTVYASAERVYVAGHHWRPDGQDVATAVHGFAISGAPTYVASGEVPGELLNQFAMDRYEGHLRIATTVRKPDGSTDSRVTVLAERGSGLAAVGTVTGLGRPGETIRGIRYLGPVGYVVTFEQTDPLYTVDLRDPTAPRARGELKVPGYSAYLHPTGDGQLLGVGSAATEDGQITGVQVSLFDVSDLDAPARDDVLELSGSSTPIEWDHHAFTWVGGEQLAVIPFEGHGWVVPQGDGAEPGGPGVPAPTALAAGLLLVRVADGGLVEVATVGGPRQEGWSPGFQRTVVHDGTLLAVGPGTVWRIGLDGAVLARTDL